MAIKIDYSTTSTNLNRRSIVSRAVVLIVVVALMGWCWAQSYWYSATIGFCSTHGLPEFGRADLVVLTLERGGMLLTWDRILSKSPRRMPDRMASNVWFSRYSQVQSTSSILLPHTWSQWRSWHRKLGLDWAWMERGSDTAGRAYSPMLDGIEWYDRDRTIGIIFPVWPLDLCLLLIGWWLVRAVSKRIRRRGRGLAADALRLT